MLRHLYKQTNKTPNNTILAPTFTQASNQWCNTRRRKVIEWRKRDNQRITLLKKEQVWGTTKFEEAARTSAWKSLKDFFFCNLKAKLAICTRVGWRGKNLDKYFVVDKAKEWVIYLTVYLFIKNIIIEIVIYQNT